MKKEKKETFSILAFPADLEEETRFLYDLVLCQVDRLLSDCQNALEMLRQQPFQRSLYCAAHQGFHKAQTHIIEAISSDRPLCGAARCLYINIMNTVAWQMLDKQLYAARRLFLGQRPPTLKHSNFASVKKASEFATTPDFATFALISDLTSFVQVGDLLVVDADSKGLSIVEVKEGEVNKKLIDFAEFLSKSKCEAAFYNFCQAESSKTVDQFMRMAKQQARMAHFSELLSKGTSKDPDTGFNVRVPDDPFPIREYDDCLVRVIEKSKERDWAIEHIDSCLFVGAYRGQFRIPGKEVFRLWFEECSGKQKYPIINLISCMQEPLALPLFCRNILPEQMFDILFGRVVVYIGINLDGFIEVCRENGLEARWSTRKEAAKLCKEAKHKAYQPWLSNNRVLLAGSGEDAGAVADGLLCRIFFHGTSPLSAVALLQANQDASASV